MIVLSSLGVCVDFLCTVLHMWLRVFGLMTYSLFEIKNLMKSLIKNLCSTTDNITSDYNGDFHHQRLNKPPRRVDVSDVSLCLAGSG